MKYPQPSMLGTACGVVALFLASLAMVALAVAALIAL